DGAGTFTVNLEPAKFNPNLLGRVVIFSPGVGVGGGNLLKGETLFRLERAGQAQGKVVDLAGQPVVGATVSVSFISWDNNSQILWLGESPLRSKFSVKTGADGQWVIPNLPITAEANVEIDDPRYVRVSTQARVGTEIPPLIARPSAVITGKVVYEDGKPATGIEVLAQGQARGGWGSAITGADGSYRLTSLPSGAYNVMVGEQPEAFVAAALEGVMAREGETKQVPDLVLTPGGMIEGTVVDAGTGKPLPDTGVGSYGPHRPRSGAAIINAYTDKEGRYKLRVAPGESYLYIYDPPQGYLRPEDQNRQEPGSNITVEKGQTKTLDFRLHPALTLTGTAVDTEGKPVAGAKIRIGSPWQGTSATTDETGKFTISNLKPGEATLSARGEWQVVQPAQLKLPVAGPLKVTLRRLQLMTVAARVLTPQGQPVVGATVKLSIDTPSDTRTAIDAQLNDDTYSSRTEQLTTDAEGRFSINLRPKEKLSLIVEKLGYRYVSGGQVTTKTGRIEVSDTILTPLPAQLEGRVVDAAGTAVAGAKVLSPEGGALTPVVTDETGRFVLKELPEGEVTVVAIHRSGAGQVKVRTGGAPVEISLTAWKPPASRDIQRGYAILEAIFKQSAGTKYDSREMIPMMLAPYDPELTLKLARGTAGDVSDSTLSAIISIAVEANPVGALEWALRLLEEVQDTRIMMKNSTLRIYAVTNVGQAIAALKPDVAAELYQQAKALVKSKDLSNEAISDYMALAILAARLKNPEAETMLQMAMALTERNYSETPGARGSSFEGMMAALAEGVAQGSPELVEKVIEQLSPGAQVKALSYAIPEIARYDPATAQRLLERIEKMPRPASPERQLNSDLDYAFGQAAKAVIQAIGKTDPAGAMSLALRVKDSNHRAKALALAAQFQSKEVATTLFRDAMTAAQVHYWESVTAMHIAAMAYETDPQLGVELFAQARTLLQRKRPDDSNPGVATFAYYYARVDPAESRMLLEQEFVRLMQAIGGSNRSWAAADVALAMAAVDVDRALELARSVPDERVRFEAQRKIAQYVLASESVRRIVPFNRWGQSDTWRPDILARW
ncbi:MAG: carboxypeptidase regulatory-like domain-containing protein, partial [Armatimonadota bacterium]|nr:carboxypeptidase regulatory-like domain-containing protein [Armatimonadota bacterium]